MHLAISPCCLLKHNLTYIFMTPWQYGFSMIVTFVWAHCQRVTLIHDRKSKSKYFDLMSLHFSQQIKTPLEWIIMWGPLSPTSHYKKAFYSFINLCIIRLYIGGMCMCVCRKQDILRNWPMQLWRLTNCNSSIRSAGWRLRQNFCYSLEAKFHLFWETSDYASDSLRLIRQGPLSLSRVTCFT